MLLVWFLGPLNAPGAGRGAAADSEDAVAGEVAAEAAVPPSRSVLELDGSGPEKTVSMCIQASRFFWSGCSLLQLETFSPELRQLGGEVSEPMFKCAILVYFFDRQNTGG